MKHIPALLLLAVLGLAGCKPAATTTVAPSKSATPTSFNAVTARLDSGGELFFYLSSERAMQTVRPCAMICVL